MKLFQKAPIALAVTALMVAPVAFAQDGGEFSASSNIDSDFTNNIDVDLRHRSITDKRFNVNITVRDRAGHYSGAAVDSKQFTAGNEVENLASENNATIGTDVGTDATGNVGINVAAGDNNAQANDAALSASDASRVFGQAEIYSAQDAAGNLVTNSGSPNNAVLGGGSLSGASGNIGVNIAAGVSNAQQNSLAASSNEKAGHTRATVGGVQQTYGNDTTNKAHKEKFYDVAAVVVGGSLSGTYQGGGEGSYDGNWRQTNDVYPEVWGVGGGEGTNHEIGGGAPYLGHIDFDDKGTAGQDGRFEGSEEGSLGFSEAGTIALGGVMSGFALTTNTVYINNENNATLGSGALQGVSGNVGVNIAAGTNNLQRNSLAIASSMGGSNGE